MNKIIAALGFSLLTAACGGSDGPSNDGGGGSSPSGAGGSGAIGDAGASSAGDGSDPLVTGGSSAAGSSAAGSSASGSSASGSSGAGSNATGGTSAGGDCELDAPIVSCYVEAGQGAAVCTETALDGTSAQVVRDQCGGTVSEEEHCPTKPALAGYCKGGITTYYYEPASTKIWTNIGASCEATGGVWCGI